MKALLLRNLQTRQGGAWLLALTYGLLGTVLRLGFLLASAGEVSWGWPTFAALLIGALFDVGMAWFLTLPLVFLSLVGGARWQRWVLWPAWTLGAFIFTFWKVSEILFWEEFGVRFNFIAVDYLIYTTEVVKNIKESYNMPAIIAGVLAVVGALFFLWRRLGFTALWATGSEQDTTPRWRTLAWVGGPLSLILLSAYVVGRQDLKAASTVHTSIGERLVAGFRHMGAPQPNFANSYDSELAKNGEYAFLTAFWANQLEWKRFYPTAANDPVAGLSARLHGAQPTGILRTVSPTAAPRRLNVIQITIESLSAEFVGCYGEPDYAAKQLTPNLDRLAKESLWFRHCYAGGTRTVRGMEALTLSIPPIPGQSVLRRKGCEDLCTLGSVLKHAGYDTAFIYGGDGFFDNMSYFFGTNGYRVVDLPRQTAAGKQPTFANAWGVCDEDAFTWSIEEADKAHAAGKPFHHFVMTTSNHRPYTWPAGKIDPKLVGRDGGVAYTDYAIGAFLKAAQAKPWFKDTVFVIVADHCASVAGKRELEIRKYEIPLFIWSPAHIPAQRFDLMMSQIDTAPTVLGLLNLPYASRFVGADVFQPGYQPRAFISNYQKVALLRGDGLLTVLKPVRNAAQYQATLTTGALAPRVPTAGDLAALQEAIEYYQGTDQLFNQGGLANPQR